jgi:hypothetical protein
MDTNQQDSLRAEADMGSSHKRACSGFCNSSLPSLPNILDQDEVHCK